MAIKYFAHAMIAVLMSALVTAAQQNLAFGQNTSISNNTLRNLASTLFAIEENRIIVGPRSGSPEVMRVERDGALVGYLASTATVIGSVGYSGKPIDILVAIDTAATIRGAHLLAQSEPILTIGVSEADIAKYIGSFKDIALGRAKPNETVRDGLPDAISGATVSSGVIRDGIIRTGRAVALAYGLLASRTSRRLDRTGFVESDWTDLIGSGGLGHRLVTFGDIRQALASPDYAPAAGGPEGTFIEIYFGLLTPPQIGQNLLGKRDYNQVMTGSDLDDHFIFVAANGLYSFKGTRWRKSGFFERLELLQDNRTIQFTKDGYRNIADLALAGAPSLREIALFKVAASSGFDPTRPWRLSLVVSHETEGGARIATALPLHYTIADRFLQGGESREAGKADLQLWERNWWNRVPAIIVVCAMLLVLAVILVFQDSLARRFRLYQAVRLAFLAATLVILGWGLGAQLSVVQVLAFAQAIRTGFQWETFLLDPLIFILWSAVAVSLLFWGRGVFCGWLCPFGALQELLNTAARRLGIQQIAVPFGLHERLWPIKYIAFLGLFALSLHSITHAFVFAEIEPFKTAITLKFMREWPFLIYVALLLMAGLFVERAYCRYLCPLGAALAIPARLRMFEWLKRRPQCGRECRICAVRCTVQAIHPNGQINPNECIHCLRCQTNYFDQTTCPPLKERARRRAAFAPKKTTSEPAPNSRK